MYDLSCKIYRRLVHIFCDIYNRTISVEEAEEEQIQLAKEINDIKPIRALWI